ncbi:tryptophan synthase subunit alpha [Bacillaceae bacterium W0354]
MTTMIHGRAYLEKSLKNELQNNSKIFIPYVMAGDGGLEQLIPTLQRLEEAGVSAIELGIPFSDPAADGPTIQEAGIRALKEGVTLQAIIELLQAERNKINIPIIFMTYMNPIFKYGLSKFIRDAQLAGVDGLIIPDLPLEQNDLINKQLNEAGIALIQLVSLTSSEERMREIAQASQGFLYAITVNGITGARKDFNINLKNHLAKLKKVSDVPVLAGFGISTPDHVKEMCDSCDGVIVGSKIIELLQQKEYEAINQLVKAKNR